LRYSVSVVPPTVAVAIGPFVGEAAGEGDSVPPGDALSLGDALPLGDADALGDPVGEGDCERAASGRSKSIETRERTTTTPIALDRFLKRALLYAVA